MLRMAGLIVAHDISGKYRLGMLNWEFIVVAIQPIVYRQS